MVLTGRKERFFRPHVKIGLRSQLRSLKNKEVEGRGVLRKKEREKGMAVRSESVCKSPLAELLVLSTSRVVMLYPTHEDIIIPGVLYRLKAMLSRMF